LQEVLHALSRASEIHQSRIKAVEPSAAELEQLSAAEMLLKPVKSMLPVRAFWKSNLGALPHCLQGMQKYSSHIEAQLMQQDPTQTILTTPPYSDDKAITFLPGSMLVCKSSPVDLFFASLTAAATEISCNPYVFDSNCNLHCLNEKEVTQVPTCNIMAQWDKFPYASKVETFSVANYEMKTLKKTLGLPSYAASTFLWNAKCCVCLHANEFDLIFCVKCSSAFHVQCLGFLPQSDEPLVCNECKIRDEARERELQAEEKSRKEAVRPPSTVLTSKRKKKPNNRYTD
jgi:hypothetical protein